jgi:hypothetical protein
LNLLSMDTEAFFRSITQELSVFKDRAQGFVGSNHWQTVGEYKESLLRAVLRRHLPETAKVGRGFIVESNGEPSTQIDVIIYDAESPILYRDGDLVFLAPEAVRGVVEVKTGLRASQVTECLGKLIDLREIFNRCAPRARFLGLFVYEARELDLEVVVRGLQAAAQREEKSVIPYVCLGENGFVSYLRFGPEDTFHPLFSWRTYSLPGIGPGCFVSRLINCVSEGGSDPFDVRASFPFPNIEKYKEKDFPLHF